MRIIALMLVAASLLLASLPVEATEGGHWSVEVMRVGETEGSNPSAMDSTSPSTLATERHQTGSSPYNTPLQQKIDGAKLFDIRCNEPLELYIRDGQIPICLRHTTHELLIERDVSLVPIAEYGTESSDIVAASKIVRQTIESAIATYDENGGGHDGLDSLTKSSTELYYPFVVDRAGYVVAHGVDPSTIGTLNIDTLNLNITPEEIFTALVDEGDEIWVEYDFTHPQTGNVEHKRALLVLHDGYIFGSGYYLTEDGALQAQIPSITADLQTVKIGALIPQTGRNDNAGEHRTVATEVAEADFNAYLEEKGAAWRLEVVIRDTGANPDQALQAAKSFNEEGIKFVVGPSASSAVMNIKPYADENDMVILSCCSTSPSLSIEDDSVFRLAPDDTTHGPVVAELMREDGRTVLIPIWRDDTWGSGLYNSTVDRFKELGGVVDTGIGSYDPCTEDGCYSEIFSEMALALSSTVQHHIDDGHHSAQEIAVMFIGFSETADFVKTASKHTVLGDVRWFGSDAVVQSSNLVSEDMIEFTERVQFSACIFAADTSTDQYRHVSAQLAERISEDANVYVYASYDAVWVMGLAIEAAGGSDDPLLVREMIPIVVESYDAAIGIITLNDAGDSETASYDVWTIKDGGWQYIGVYNADVGFAVPMPTSKSPSLQ